MKKDLIELINCIDEIKKNFKQSGGHGMPLLNTIYTNDSFITWKQETQFELQDIYDRTKDKFVWGVLVLLKRKFNGWKDEQEFREISGGLNAILKNIDKYYPSEKTETPQIKKDVKTVQKKSKIFISHASKDVEYVNHIVELLEDLGLGDDNLFCSSIPGYGIPLNKDIYDYLRQQFDEYNIHVIYILSSNYYNSTACMNEMGAAWVLRNKYTMILLPEFKFEDIDGAINPRQIGIKLDGKLDDLKEKLNNLKDIISEEFNLNKIKSVRWEKKRDGFIAKLKSDGYGNNTTILSEIAELILKELFENSSGTLLMTKTFSGTSIQVGSKLLLDSDTRREVAKWEAGVEELLTHDLIVDNSGNNEVFKITNEGYKFIEATKI